MSLPKKCLVDTNVPINANLAIDPATIPDNLVACVQSCVDAIDHVMKKGEFVIDSGDEIYSEYLNNLCLSGQKGIGNAFMLRPCSKRRSAVNRRVRMPRPRR